MSTLLEALSVLQWTLSFVFMGPGCSVLMIYLLLFTRFWWLVLLYGIWYFYDRPTPVTGGRTIHWFRNWTVWRLMASYFPVHLHKTCDLDSSENYILGYHPHGVLSAGAFLHFATEGTNFSNIFRGLKPHLAVLKGHFDFPIYRDYFLTTGCVAVNKKSLRYILNKGDVGHLLALVVGGASEALEAHPGKYKIHLKNRKGFVKIALETGTSLVPCLSFGETDMFQQLDNPPGSLVRRIQDALTKVFGFSPPIFHGRGPLLPYSKPVNTVVGGPISVPKIAEPTQQDIDSMHQKYSEELQKLFNEFKTKYAREDSVLEIV